MRISPSTAAVLLFFAALPLSARDVEVLVEDIELGLPLEGAQIRSWDGAHYVCNDEGKAVIAAPDDRPVVIQASYPGYASGRLVIAPGALTSTLGLRLEGIMENRELVVEASRPGTGETRTGRSVAISGRDMTQTAEIGIIEDVMNSVKLLPGVGYTGLFDAQPSIRGGDPGDMNASLDGFYIFNPYHWGGGFSIFDPRMVQSAQLSHGVFSSRYGHTISGLLEISSKKPSPVETEFELGINTSTANANVSLPLAGKGGILFMGRVTYYDPVIWLAQALSGAFPEIDQVNSIRTAPYIRSASVTGNYRFSDTLELQATGFFGMDGVGVSYKNSSRTTGLSSDSSMEFDWTNYQGFITSGLSWNPRGDMLLKLTAGAGFEDAVVDADIKNIIHEKAFLPTPANEWYYMTLRNYSSKFKDKYTLDTSFRVKETDEMFNVQGRLDYDWEPGGGFLAAAGVQEMFSAYSARGSQRIARETRLGRFEPEVQDAIFADMGVTDPALQEWLKDYLRVNFPLKYDPDASNKMFTTSGYVLAEYASAGGRFNAELGLRIDHFYLSGRDNFSVQSEPALNPRLNLDFNVLKNRWIIDSLDLSAGTGLFSSVNDVVIIAEERYNLSEIKPNRSWTSVLGAKLELDGGIVFNIEGYYKYIFDRTYVPINFTPDDIDVRPQFNGEGAVWGIDLLLQKLQSRYFDGWVSYSYSWARYRDPDAGAANMGISGGVRGDEWYFPSYHRFHNLNLILNVKPAANVNIYARFGLASGVQIGRRVGDGPVNYPVYVYDPENPEKNQFIEKYYWPSAFDENHRTSPSLPLDIKFSIFGKSRSGKIRHEVYVAVENVLALLYTAKGNTSFNSYTGEVDTGSDSASYEMPIPIPSFGFKISY